MEVAFFPSLLGSNLQMLTPLPISPGIHYPDISKARTKLALAISGPRTQTKNPAYLGSGLCSLLVGVTCPLRVIPRRETVL